MAGVFRPRTIRSMGECRRRSLPTAPRPEADTKAEPPAVPSGRDSRDSQRGTLRGEVHDRISNDLRLLDHFHVQSKVPDHMTTKPRFCSTGAAVIPGWCSLVSAFDRPRRRVSRISVVAHCRVQLRTPPPTPPILDEHQVFRLVASGSQSPTDRQSGKVDHRLARPAQVFVDPYSQRHFAQVV